mmetsp:Transcript_3725/g.2779  ORF Transcript_3725/g.2779 Transcript_3725/m.2779 type:complete len:159 (+) Transcript_3725:345-821(+)|eukprot:CAMPEP_0202977922 /NCGR_PEP_ID=MMETSP1396-20130829/84533_1 /ASSEMBLY_ACC=CAM_ASM_000872 /TAXON_ID= /ORGANISM="Pseudokeronopsis sp., Strain Brazil" /LENGTH=158 /DNA_ID=CAMNT_0049716753 /DNA_START=329 /DNA_END=805 /DNA_ORIENTATION=+
MSHALSSLKNAHSDFSQQHVVLEPQKERTVRLNSIPKERISALECQLKHDSWSYKEYDEEAQALTITFKDLQAMQEFTTGMQVEHVANQKAAEKLKAFLCQVQKTERPWAKMGAHPPANKGYFHKDMDKRKRNFTEHGQQLHFGECGYHGKFIHYDMP